MFLVPTFFWLPNALFGKAKKGARKVKAKMSKA
jgi:HAE1 family hydrophobic/amphiphilic exporter-1